MKRFASIIFFIFFTVLSYSQTDHCSLFPKIMESANTLWKQQQFEAAFAKLSAAREACPKRSKKVDEQYEAFIRDIAGKYKTADEKTKEAKNQSEIATRKSIEAKKQTDRANIATKLAEKNAVSSDSIAAAAARAARRAYANDLAYKSKIALEQNDRTTAFRLADLAYSYVDENNLNVVRALVEAAYHNEISDSVNQLPWQCALIGHSDNVGVVAFSPDGDKIASGSNDNTIKIWDWKNNKLLCTLSDHNEDVLSIAFSPDGRLIASGYRDSLIKVWDLQTKQVVHNLVGHKEDVNCVTFSPLGDKLASVSRDATVKVWDLLSGKMIINREGSPINSIAFSPDGSRLAFGSNYMKVVVLDLESQQLLSSFEHPMIWSIAFSPDGEKLASGSSDRTIKVWDIKHEIEIAKLEGHKDVVWSLAFSPNNEKLASASRDGTVKIWDFYTVKELSSMSNSKAWSVAFSPDGKHLASGTFDQKVKIWDLSLSNRQKKDTAVAEFMAISPDGQKIASILPNNVKIKILDVASKNILQLGNETDSITIVAFSFENNLLASGSSNRRIKIWDLFAGKEILLLEKNKAPIVDIAISPNGKMVAYCEKWDGTVKIVDIKSGEPLYTLIGNRSILTALSFSHDSKMLATSSLFGEVIIWDLVNGKSSGLIDCDTTKRIGKMAFSPNGKMLAINTWDGIVEIWDFHKNKIDLKISSSISSVAFSPDGNILASGSFDGAIKFWNVLTGKEILSIQGHDSHIFCLNFSSDGKKLISGSEDQEVKTWELTPDGWRRSQSELNLLLDILSTTQLSDYDLEDLLDQHPDNEAKLITTKETWQIAAFAGLYAEKIRRTGFPQKADFERALRLYAACIQSGVETKYFEEKVTSLKKLWEEKMK